MAIQFPSARASQRPGSTHTKPFMTLPVKSIGRAPLRDNASVSCSLPTRNMKRTLLVPQSMFPRSRKHTPPNIRFSEMLRRPFKAARTLAASASFAIAKRNLHLEPGVQPDHDGLVRRELDAVDILKHGQLQETVGAYVFRDRVAGARRDPHRSAAGIFRFGLDAAIARAKD